MFADSMATACCTYILNADGTTLAVTMITVTMITVLMTIKIIIVTMIAVMGIRIITMRMLMMSSDDHEDCNKAIHDEESCG
jgi:hypothetical protein